MNKIYTNEEIRSLRFYQGDKGLTIKDKKLQQFYSTKKAYKTINVLMYDGIENEKTRIFKEKGKLSPHLFLDIKEVLKVYRDIFFIMNKFSDLKNETEIKYFTTYRTERKAALESLKKGFTISLTSTSKKQSVEENFARKDGLFLLEFKMFSDIPYIDMNEVLGKRTTYANQEEILLPPFLKINMVSKELTEKEKSYKDVNRKVPIGKFEVYISNNLDEWDVSIQEETILEDYLIDENRIKNAISVIEMMNNGYKPKEKEVQDYIQWKVCFQKLIKIYFQKYIRNGKI